jgi:hypothetical protein
MICDLALAYRAAAEIAVRGGILNPVQMLAIDTYLDLTHLHDLKERSDVRCTAHRNLMREWVARN